MLRLAWLSFFFFFVYVFGCLVCLVWFSLVLSGFLVLLIVAHKKRNLPLSFPFSAVKASCLRKKGKYPKHGKSLFL